MGKKSLWAQVTIFLAFIALFFILNLLTPDRSFSERENRYLQQSPKFAFSSLFSGGFMSDFEKYTTDQFTFRDSWTTLKARCELLMGKDVNNGVYLCRSTDGEGDMLIKGFGTPDSQTLDSDIAALNTLTENAGVPVFFALIPDKSEIYADRLPKNAPNDSEEDVINYCYAASKAETIDMLSPLAQHADEYIFYRTDHHWTSTGAYYGYTAIAEAMGLTPAPPTGYAPEKVSTDFYGTMWSSSGFSWVAPDSIDIFVQPPEGLSITNYPEGQPLEGKLYDYSYLAKKDQYSFFLGGNTPLQQIKTGSDGPSLLIVRDSYADSLVPFLLGDFSEIDVLDLRYYRASLSDYIAENKIDAVVVCYNISDFCEDSNIFLLGR